MTRLSHGVEHSCPDTPASVALRVDPVGNVLSIRQLAPLMVLEDDNSAFLENKQ